MLLVLEIRSWSSLSFFLCFPMEVRSAVLWEIFLNVSNNDGCGSLLRFSGGEVIHIDFNLFHHLVRYILVLRLFYR